MDSINNINSNDLISILDSVLNKKKGLIEHHIESMNKFNDTGIKQIMTNGFNIQVELYNERNQTEAVFRIARSCLSLEAAKAKIRKKDKKMHEK